MIPFNRPHLTGAEIGNLAAVLESRKLSGDGPFTKRCQARLEEMLGGGTALLTTSCTDALEAAALLCKIEPGDEVLVPSFTFVSTANAFALRGAKIRFVDSLPDQPNLDHDALEALVGERTRVIVPVHYAGVACDMDAIRAVAEKHDLMVVEDAAQAISATYRGQPLGSLGDLSCFSFHETKNVVAGEAGSLVVNRPELVRAAEIVREKGTDRSAFFRGEVDKYGWVALGSSYLPSELVAATLLAQLERVEAIQAKRVAVWRQYAEELQDIGQSGRCRLMTIPDYASNNAHMFYLLCDGLETRTSLIGYLKAAGIMAVFHYQTLHDSAYFAGFHDGRELVNASRYAATLVRLPLFADLSGDDVSRVCEAVRAFFKTS